jgi:hypothetical protein
MVVIGRPEAMPKGSRTALANGNFCRVVGRVAGTGEYQQPPSA